MRLVVLFLVASIPLFASTIDVSAWCSSAPTNQGLGWASCGDSFDSASATVSGLSAAANAWAAPDWYRSNATASLTEDLVFTFFGGTGPGFAQPWLTLSASMHFGSNAAATATFGACLVGPGGVCDWNSMPFVFGVPETVTLTLNVGAATYGEWYDSATASASAEFDGFFGFSDVNGYPLSGVTYTMSPAGEAPEPATLLLTAMAGAVLLACALRKRPAGRH